MVEMKEFLGVDFSDLRLNRRLSKLAQAVAARPGKSFPEAVGSVSALEATYRFLGNDKVTADRILAPHIAATVGRACHKERVIVAHDTTELLFSGKSRRDELGWSNQGNQGFLAHVSLAISRSELNEPLGVVGIRPFFRTGKPKGRGIGKKPGVQTEALRWWQSANDTEKLFPADVRPIHVMDREADEYELLSELSRQDFRFVIRIRHNRKRCANPGGTHKKKLFELLSGLDVLCEREVPICKKGRRLPPIKRKDHQARGARIAKLQITATSVEVPRTVYATDHFPKTVVLNYVRVSETGAPEGEEPVDWKLVTSEPIENVEDVLNVVDDYRARWMIEEYFKALKSGCAYEKRQLESRHSLLNALAVFAPIAWQLLSLRTLSRQKTSSDVGTVLTKQQTDVLRAVSQKKLPENITAEQALLAIGALGGHIPNNGSPGWAVLARGMETLLTMEIAWNCARKRCDQS